MKFDMFSTFQEFLEEFLSGQRENLLVWIPVFLGLGSALYFGLLYEPSVPTVCGLLAGLVFLCASMFRLYHREPNSFLLLSSFILSACLLCMSIGFGAAKLKTDLVDTIMIDRETRPVMVSAIVDHREEQEGNKGTLLFLSGVKIEGWDADKTPAKIRITARQKNDAAAGDRVEFLAKLTPLSPPVAPQAYDFARHYYFEGIGALGFTLSKVTVTDRADVGLINLENLRTSISNHIQTVVPEREAGIASALMTGERAAIADEDWNALRASGLAHIISISGLHVAMVAAPVFFLVRLFLAMIPFVALRYPTKKIAAGAALLVCCLYVGLVVPSVPTTRSLLMTGVALIAIMLDRSPFSLRLVGVSAILVLLASPESIWSVSFQMSFAAVAALVAMAEAMRPYATQFYTDAGWVKRGALWLAGMLMTSLVASLATAPYSLYHFQQVASYSVLANALSVPISGLMIMPMVIISYVLLPFGAADWSLKILGLGVDWLLDIARWTQDLSGSVITSSAMPDMFLVMMTITGLILILFKGWGRMVAMLPFCVAMMSIWTMDRPDMIVSNDGGVMAVRDTRHVYLSSLRKNKFASDTWLKRWDKAQEDVVLFPKQGQISLENGGSISCDSLACRIDMKGIKVSFGDGIYELKQDCAWANVIISDVRLPKDLCPEQNIQQFGYYDFKNRGAISIFRGNSPRIQEVGNDRGIRPWSQPYQSKAYKGTKDD
ncbi:MAG: hypothetical protein A3B66_06630 [Alphaproteobacteria bacterium RIFCSPHIGHO2_02_FULL_46_13]|nr:MAG: hypothetical protein A3B66_06630 [Alphaproteobacteria bacterium RIFCSPHIGHO2_02_FULL_46_13]